MSRSELHEHISYWQDDVKIAAYTSALEEVISPGDRVLDLGAGTGLLGILAARAGAGQVWSYDYGPILGIARELAQTNGVADKIHFVNEMTTSGELPEVDVIICDQIGGLVYDAGILDYYADAASRALRPGGTLVPGSFDVYLAAVEAPRAYEAVSGWQTSADIDLAPARRIATNTEYRVGPHDLSLLADGERFASMASNDMANYSANVTFEATRSGTVHGLSGWFVAQMSPSVTLSNDPTAEQRMDRWLNFYPLETPIEVEAGQKITATIDIRPAGPMVTWSVAVEGERKQRMSTFQGAFMFDTQQGLSMDVPLREPERRAAAATELLGLAAQGASTAELTAAASAYDDLFPTEAAAKNFAGRLRGLLES